LKLNSELNFDVIYLWYSYIIFKKWLIICKIYKGLDYLVIQLGQYFF